MIDFHRLERSGVHLIDSDDGGMLVHNGFGSLLVIKVKEKKGNDHRFLKLMKTLLNKSVLIFIKGGDDVLRY